MTPSVLDCVSSVSPCSLELAAPATAAARAAATAAAPAAPAAATAPATAAAATATAAATAAAARAAVVAAAPTAAAAAAARAALRRPREVLFAGGRRKVLRHQVEVRPRRAQRLRRGVIAELPERRQRRLAAGVRHCCVYHHALWHVSDLFFLRRPGVPGWGASWFRR